PSQQNTNGALPLRAIRVVDELSIQAVQAAGDALDERSLRRTRRRLQQSNVVADIAAKQIHEQRIMSAESDAFRCVQLAQMGEQGGALRCRIISNEISVPISINKKCVIAAGNGDLRCRLRY